MADERKTYRIKFVFESHVDMKASSAEEAAKKFDRIRDVTHLSQMLVDGYDDFTPEEPKEVPGR